jgi:hypothetical protein
VKDKSPGGRSLDRPLLFCGRFGFLGCGWLGSFCRGWRWSGGRCEGTDEDYELPALVFCEFFAEGGHGLPALGDLVKDFAISEGVHVLGFGEVAGRRIVHHGVGAVAFAGIAVAVGAVFVIDGLCGVEIGVGGSEGIFAEFVFERNAPGRFVESGEADGEEDQENHQGEEEFEESFWFLRRSGHFLFTEESFA